VLRDLRADASSRSKRKSLNKWPSSPKVGKVRKERQRAWGWKVECDSSIDPEAARSKMGSQEKEVGEGRDGSDEMARKRSVSCRVSIC